ncbi:MAG: ABC transporter permease [Bacteroidetes bacterium]|nr:MAG: ABC transporter permease [Bacteroidota bacterium]
MIHYSQWRASFSIAKASLLAMIRSPTAVVFSLLFPIIFIVVFGSMVNVNSVYVKVAVAPDCDTANIVYRSLTKSTMIELYPVKDTTVAIEDLQKGRIAAILKIKSAFIPPGISLFKIHLTSSTSAEGKLPVVQSALKEITGQMNEKAFPNNPKVAGIDVSKLPGRKYRQIDFILPGQLGFSLLMAGVFGSAFLFFNLRQSLVLKRIAATPISKFHIIIGELMSRLVFQVLSFVLMIALGYFAFHFTLINGIYTFLEMLFFSLFGLFIFMGLGFIISGLIQNESSIAPVANTITLPQILLCGLFFPIENFPHAMQTFCRFLPLSFFVDGLRKIAFEGFHFWELPLQLFGLIVWAAIVFFVTVKVFKWE